MTKTIKLSTLLSTGKLWEKGDHSRTYLNSEDVATALGFTWARYKTGNIKHASFGDEEISNSEMRRVFGALDGVYYDNHAKKFGAARFFMELLKSYDVELVDDVNVETEEAQEAEVPEAEETKEEATHTRGGRREGAGRKPAGHVPSTIRLTPEQTEMLKDVGGSAFMRTLLDDIIAGEVAIPVDTSKFTDEQKARFVEGWEQAGGPTDDAESDTPWCSPWHWQSVIVVRGLSFEAWGADWYRQCRDEIEAIRAEDEE